MAEEKQQLQGIDWQETFAFTNVFRSFRLAIHPSKLVLAFVGLAICFIAGLALDRLWYGGAPIIWEHKQPIELGVFAGKGAAGQDFGSWYKQKCEAREDKLKERCEQLNISPEDANIKSAGLASKLIAEKKARLEDYLSNKGLQNILQNHSLIEECRISLKAGLIVIMKVANS